MRKIGGNVRGYLMRIIGFDVRGWGVGTCDVDNSAAGGGFRAFFVDFREAVQSVTELQIVTKNTCGKRVAHSHEQIVDGTNRPMRRVTCQISGEDGFFEVAAALVGEHMRRVLQNAGRYEKQVLGSKGLLQANNCYKKNIAGSGRGGGEGNAQQPKRQRERSGRHTRRR